MIAALQETLVSGSNYPAVLHGYTSYAVHRQEGFRGQLLLVDDRLSSYQIPHDSDVLRNVLVHVKVSGIAGVGTALHVFALYLPSGGNFRKQRRLAVKEVRLLANAIQGNEANAPVLILGDFNCEPDWLDRQLSKGVSSVRRQVPIGSDWSRFPKGGGRSSLDHFVMNGEAAKLLKRPRVQRHLCISDHRAVATWFRRLAVPDHVADPLTRRPKFVYDSKMIQRQSERIVHDNRWSALVDLEVDSPEKLTEFGDRFKEVNEKVLRDNASMRPKGDSDKMYLPRRIAKLLKEYRKFSNMVAGAKGSARNRALRNQERSLRRYVKRRHAWERSQEQKRITNLAQSFVSHDYKSVWNEVQSRIGSVRGGEGLNPVKNSRGELQLTSEGILDAVMNHYRILAQDDENRRSRDSTYWDGIDLGQPKDPLPHINEDLRWTEVLLAIRGMNRNTTPGKDGVHVNVLKVLVREECLAALKAENPAFNRPHHVWVDLPADKLPVEPLTPMGKSLFKILSASWALEKTPPCGMRSTSTIFLRAVTQRCW
ncbi:hypothetical protein FRC08_002957 [Ceratobasidium sp. 394]|nr:hypothetical protein FRC08_002957 [Ceratobasidium sp. 394]